MDALSEYTEAMKHYHAGDRSQAALHVSRAVGSENTLPVIESSIVQIMTAKSPGVMSVILKLMEDKEK